MSWSIKDKWIAESNLRIIMSKGEIITNGKEIRIISRGKTKVIKEDDIVPLISGVFNINPDANGEAYGIEDRIFIDAVSKKKNGVISDGDFAIKTELMIQKCYGQ